MQKIEAKIVIVGSMSCGKTSTMLQFIKNSFSDHLPSTIGASYMCKPITIKNIKMKLQIWDSAGQEQYQSLVGMYFRKSDAAILMYDITSNKSFSDLKSWKKEIERYAPEDMILSLVGNKADLESERVISVRQGKDAAKNLGALFFETSAKENSGITELFQTIAEKILSKRKDIEIDDDYEFVSNSPAVELVAPIQVSKSHTPRFPSICCKKG